MRDFVESATYRHIAVQNLALYAQRLGKLFASASTWYKMIRERGWRRPRTRVHPIKPKEGLRATLDSTAAVRRLVAFYVGEHNEKIPRAVLGARTPDEVYFGREENVRERLSEQHRGRRAVLLLHHLSGSLRSLFGPRASVMF